MKKHSDKLIGLVTLIIIAASGYGVSASVYWVFMGVIGLDAKLSAAIIAACTTVIVSVLTVVYTQWNTKSREIDNSHRPQKMEIYKRFMNEVVVNLLKAKKEDKVDSPEFKKKLEEDLFSFTGDIIVWGSPTVILAYTAFRSSGTTSEDSEKSSLNILLKIDGLFQAMRKDLGNSNWGLTRGDLIKLFLTDPETLEKQITSTYKN
jgi:hypothetical protein